MKKLSVLLFAIFVNVCSLPCFAIIHSAAPIYVDPYVARVVLEKHFGNMTTKYAKYFISEYTDKFILTKVVEAYNKVLHDNSGRIPVTAGHAICAEAFKYLKPTVSSQIVTVFNSICMDFARDLMFTEVDIGQNPSCIYTIEKVGGDQTRIKYKKTDGKGFIRNNGGLPWRFYNPGAVRGSSLECANLKTKNGSFAVFENEHVGFQAIKRTLLGKRYDGLTIEQAIYSYAPPHENNTARYVRDLSSQGVNINSVLPNLTEEEWEMLIKSIARIEGYYNVGTIDNF